MPFCNFNFFFNCITTQINYFKPVAKSRLNILNIICGSNKQYFT